MHGGNIISGIDIDFSVSLNPYTDNRISALIETAIKEGTDDAIRYPDIAQTAVRAAIAFSSGTIPECVIAGNGSSELIMALVRALSPKTALLTEPCFTGYRYALGTVPGCDIRVCRLHKEDGFEMTEDILSCMTNKTDLLFLCDPGNPSGRNIDEELLVRILERAYELGISVLLDESFYMLSDKCDKYTYEKRAKHCDQFPNLYILRSYTKCFALPGIRMGYLMSSPENIKMIRKHLPEWNLSSISSALMRRLSEVRELSQFLEKSRDFIRNERSFLSESLSGLGFCVYKSDSNYLLFESRYDNSVKSTYEKCIERGLLIRVCDDFDGLGPDYHRVSVRSHEDNEQLISALGSF